MEAIVRIQSEGRLDLSKAMRGRQLSYYKRQAGDEMLGACLTGIILSINASYNIGKAMSQLQAAETAKALLQAKWYWKLAEVYLFADMAKNGDFGKVYDRLDRAVLFEWAEKFDEKREDKLFADMSGSNDTDDVPEEELTEKEKTDRTAARAKADAALGELAGRLRLVHPTGGSLRDKLTDPRFRAAAMQYELNDPEQKAIREHNQKIEEELQIAKP